MNTEKTLLVSGASGQLGRKVVEFLLDNKAGRIIAATRNPENCKMLEDRDVEVRRADFDVPETLDAAFKGVDRMLLISTDAVGQPGKRAAQHKQAIDAAVRAGIQHIVYTSLSHAESGSPVLIADDHVETEKVLAESSVGFTVLRNNLYTDLLLMSLPQAVVMGKLFAAAPTGGAAYITREDCARAAAAALACTFEGTRILELTGSTVISYGELAAITGEVTGKTITFVPMEPDALKIAMVQNGVPELIADLMISFDVGMERGLFGPASSTFEELCNQESTDVKSFLQANRQALVGALPQSENTS